MLFKELDRINCPNSNGRGSHTQSELDLRALIESIADFLVHCDTLSLKKQIAIEYFGAL